jgi:hypothetical protein
MVLCVPQCSSPSHSGFREGLGGEGQAERWEHESSHDRELLIKCIHKKAIEPFRDDRWETWHREDAIDRLSVDHSVPLQTAQMAPALLLCNQHISLRPWGLNVTLFLSPLISKLIIMLSLTPSFDGLPTSSIFMIRQDFWATLALPHHEQ